MNDINLARLLIELGTAGVEVRLDAAGTDQLGLRPLPRDQHLLDRLRMYKPVIQGLLRTGMTVVDGQPDAEYTFFERIGIADELHLPTHPGSGAWLVAAGEAIAEAGASRGATQDYSESKSSPSRIL